MMTTSFDSVTGIAKDLSFRFTPIGPMDRDDLFQEAYIVFDKCVKKFKEGTADFLTYFHRALVNHYNALRRHWHRSPLAKDDTIVYELENTDHATRPDIHAEWVDRVANLSDEARMVVGVVCNGPVDALGIVATTPPRLIRGKLRKHLIGTGWTPKGVSAAYNEIKAALQ